MDQPHYGGVLGSLRKRTFDRCGYGYKREFIPSSYWNNPHVCYSEKLQPATIPKDRMPRRNVPRWSKRKTTIEKGELRKDRMTQARNRVMRLRALKNPSNISMKPLQGRLHVALQTSDYLEALYDDPPTSTSCTQTNLDRPETPPFIPEKTGVDTCTQIYPDDLFFFDEEVKPILEVTTGKTIEQALLEVLHEDEIDGMEQERRRFMDEKAAEEAEIQRLEEEERRKNLERDKRIAEMEKAKEKQKELEKRIAATMLSDRVCTELLPQVLTEMTEQGYYVDATDEAVRDDVMKDLEEHVCQELKAIAQNEQLLSGIIKDIVQERYDVYTELGEHPQERFSNELPEMPWEETDGEDEGHLTDANFE
ncbi:hypothetical protein M8J77_010796 [Diaphorina citri]|nr:hypothetical protein M8J77_010796 [Diaphorina citri]